MQIKKYNGDITIKFKFEDEFKNYIEKNKSSR